MSTSLFTAETFTANVSTLSSAVIDGAKFNVKIKVQFGKMAEPAYGDLALAGQVADLMTAIRRELNTKRDAYCKVLARTGKADQVDTFKKQVINQMAYAAKCAGTAMGYKLAWQQKRDCYAVEELKAANEKSGATATGKDANSSEQSAAIVEAAQANAEQSAIMAATTAKGALLALLDQFSLADLDKAFNEIVAEKSAAVAEVEAQVEAKKPRGKSAEKKASTTMADAFANAKTA